jgi:hypothetical protein
MHIISQRNVNLYRFEAPLVTASLHHYLWEASTQAARNVALKARIGSKRSHGDEDDTVWNCVNKERIVKTLLYEREDDKMVE